MLMMLGVMVMMTLLIMNPDIRTTLGDVADPILDPILPQEAYFVLTVLILGSFSMTMNTVLRNFFTDPMAQAHIGHRQGQVRRMMNDARLSRDPILQEKATTLRSNCKQLTRQWFKPFEAAEQTMTSYSSHTLFGSFWESSVGTVSISVTSVLDCCISLPQGCLELDGLSMRS